MSRNRKNQSAAIRFGPVLKAIVLCGFIGGSAIGYVWQKNQLGNLGLQIKKKEDRLKQLTDANKSLAKQLDTLRSPFYLERRLKELRLDLSRPSESQIMRIVETPPGERAPRSGPLLAERSSGPAPWVK